MMITRRVSALIFAFLLFLICGISGVLLHQLYPDVPQGPGINGVFYGFMGMFIFGIAILYCLYRYRTDPSQIKVDEKPYQDERWVRVQEKGAASALLIIFGMLYFCLMYLEYICYEFLGIRDGAVIHSVYGLFLCLSAASSGAVLLSIIYYYYTKV